MQPSRYALLYLMLLPLAQVMAQESNRSKFVLENQKVSEKFLIDGILNEPAWEQANEATPFYNKWPSDSGYADAKTHVKIAFDNEFIYVSAVNVQQKNDLVIQTLKRDQQE